MVKMQNTKLNNQNDSSINRRSTKGHIGVYVNKQIERLHFSVISSRFY